MKKNQIALLCLTAVIMLAVWYIKSPLNNVSGNDNSVVVGGETTRLDALKTMRETLREERSMQVAALDKIIASEESTMAQKNTAINEKQTISDMTEKGYSFGVSFFYFTILLDCTALHPFPVVAGVHRVK